MKIKCQFMHLGLPLFLSGTQYGDKLTPSSIKGQIDIEWDTDLKEATITSAKGFCHITESYVFSYEPMQNNRPEVKQAHHAMTSDVPFKAQVSTPHDAVQAKPGKKPAKYQGEPEVQGE